VLAADGSRGRDERAARGHIIWILSALVLAYAAGAAVASALGESVGLLLIPVAVLVVVGVVLWRARDGSSGP
jgi:membrane protein DedA with SNARE-associated domain